jgi:hypothetical protein
MFFILFFSLLTYLGNQGLFIIYKMCFIKFLALFLYVISQICVIKYLGSAPLAACFKAHMALDFDAT